MFAGEISFKSKRNYMQFYMIISNNKIFQEEDLNVVSKKLNLFF